MSLSARYYEVEANDLLKRFKSGIFNNLKYENIVVRVFFFRLLRQYFSELLNSGTYAELHYLRFDHNEPWFL